MPNLTQLNIEKVIGEVHEDENSMFNILDMPIVEFGNISEILNVDKIENMYSPVHSNLVPSNETEENLSPNPIDKVSAGMNETVMSLPDLNIQNATETNNRNSFANGHGMHALNAETISSDSEHVNVLSSIKDELVTPETITVVKESPVIMSQCKSTNNVSHIWDKHLLWPSSGSVRSTKTEKKQQLPYAITSSKWREHEQKSREEKAKKELERKERILQRKIKNEENQLKKEQLKIERERKKNRKRTQNVIIKGKCTEN
ncbi:uncharacterized protein LOC143371232 [Andrena cerasifolii]|uniref:uncharacterized protein LOC143371232 n=1 Tax=Andrena cerasifolii TaxID=2819439 RepID=UPI004037F9BF